VAVPLSEDHKPQSETERSRIEAAGGFVSLQGRVNGNLNLSRSLGDLKYKQVKRVSREGQMITAEPDVTVTDLVPQDRFFVLACDGVWDIMSCQQICDFVSERLNKGMGTVEIIDQIFQRCIADDIKTSGGLGGDNQTCVIVLLNE
jgi:serine/threonine protein phosphatase PrpC